MILAKTNIKKTNQIDNIVFAKGTPKIKRQEMVKIYDFVSLMYGPWASAAQQYCSGAVWPALEGEWGWIFIIIAPSLLGDTDHLYPYC